MNKIHDLLMEVGCEEIPSRFMNGALAQLKEGAELLLEDNRLEYESVETKGTPCRLVVAVRNLADRQHDRVETIKGPPVDRAYDENGKSTRALQGFMQSQGVKQEDIEEEEIKGAPYIVVRREIPGQATENLLPWLLPRLIQKLSFPRPMYWQSKEIRFARPIRWLLALYQNKPVEFTYADVKSGRYTYGHRFLAPGPFKVNNVDHYFRLLEQKYVVVDQDRRRDMIRAQVTSTAAKKNGRAMIDSDLLEEVNYLVEYPVAVDGSFDEAFLDLPQEVLVTTMQHHQRYFPLTGQDGEKLLPYFVGISNNKFHPNIRKGYSKVLQARLSDARFFFDEDRKNPLENYVEQLKGVIFLESLGSMEQKRMRLVELTGKLCEALSLPAGQKEKAMRTAHLCKADLVTGMVKEFTDLQGVMGREYARLSGEAEEVAVGIYEHYLPRFSGDGTPSLLEGSLVSLADRIDTLAGCFAIGIQPTGSQDPYALRRQAQGAVSILLDREIEITLDDYIEYALDVLFFSLEIDAGKRERVRTALKDFLMQRMRFVFQERGMMQEVIEAVLAVPFTSVIEVYRRGSDLEEYVSGPLLDDVIIAYNRVANLVQKSDGGPVDEGLLKDEAEIALYRSMESVEIAFESLEESSGEMLEELQRLKHPIDIFFDNVMVMVEDEKLRTNRLRLLARIKKLFNRMADFSRLPAP